jgi:tripartite-type tricarboxylate transporter receptor subunit TctC
MEWTRRQAMRGLGGGLALLASGPAMTEEAYPNRVIKLIVPYPPGGTTDLLGRLIAYQVKSGECQIFCVRGLCEG